MRHRELDLDEVQDLDVKRVAIEKAKTAYKIVQGPVLVEDISLTFNELGGKLPGPFIKFFMSAVGNQGLCDLIKGKDRGARAEVVYALCTGKKTYTFSGVRYGTIGKKPKGKTNFGWDPIFTPRGETRTFAQMTSEEKHKKATRGLALKKLKQFLHHENL